MQFNKIKVACNQDDSSTIKMKNRLKIFKKRNIYENLNDNQVLINKDHNHSKDKKAEDKKKILQIKSYKLFIEILKKGIISLNSS